MQRLCGRACSRGLARRSLKTSSSRSTSTASRIEHLQGDRESRIYSAKGRSLLSWLAWLPVAYCINEYVASVVRISGSSMKPTFNPDSSELTRDVVLLSRFRRHFQSLGWSTFHRGDVIVFRHPNNPNDLVTKRIVGLAGDVVQTRSPCPVKFMRIPEGHCWVEGDESFHSRDSNDYGPVALGLIDGKVDLIVWPPPRIGRLDEYHGHERRILRNSQSL